VVYRGTSKVGVGVAVVVVMVVGRFLVVGLGVVVVGTGAMLAVLGMRASWVDALLIGERWLQSCEKKGRNW
jgi:hypothetical protein